MKKRILKTFFFALFFCLNYLFYLPAMALLNDPGYPTQVIKYQPQVTQNLPTKNGYCWTESIAASRAGAWRCMVGNTIYDPCFTTPENKIVCGANPITFAQGFILNLTKPLPTKTNATRFLYENPAHSGWLIKLADGSMCKPYTGTLPIVNNLPIKYACSDSLGCLASGVCPRQTGLLADFQTGKVWRATKVWYTLIPRLDPQVQKTETIAIATVWQ